MELVALFNLVYNRSHFFPDFFFSPSPRLLATQWKGCYAQFTLFERATECRYDDDYCIHWVQWEKISSIFLAHFCMVCKLWLKVHRREKNEWKNSWFSSDCECCGVLLLGKEKLSTMFCARLATECEWEHIYGTKVHHSAAFERKFKKNSPKLNFNCDTATLSV